uniref:Uncharacterized protein LOC105124413 isoform X2 n=1 Tax=Rhizophora mucronata TaxID=61149 RepID=A0A2P2KD41_RHIMU
MLQSRQNARQPLSLPSLVLSPPLHGCEKGRESASKEKGVDKYLSLHAGTAEPADSG